MYIEVLNDFKDNNNYIYVKCKVWYVMVYIYIYEMFIFDKFLILININVNKFIFVCSDNLFIFEGVDLGIIWLGIICIYIYV